MVLSWPCWKFFLVFPCIAQRYHLDSWLGCSLPLWPYFTPSLPSHCALAPWASTLWMLPAPFCLRAFALEQLAVLDAPFSCLFAWLTPTPDTQPSRKLSLNTSTTQKEQHPAFNTLKALRGTFLFPPRETHLFHHLCNHSTNMEVDASQILANE